MRRLRLTVPLCGMALAAAAACRADEQGPKELAPPVRLEAANGVIDVDVGHAAPYLADFDGDGLADLLVGQFGEGKLRWYRNVGSASEPKFAAPTWVEAAGKPAATSAG